MHMSPLFLNKLIVFKALSISAFIQRSLTSATANGSFYAKDHIPDTSSLSIRTSGLLGEQYLALNVGFEDPELGTSILKDGSTIQDTKSAMVLEDMIGQFLYNSKGDDNKNSGDAPAATEGHTEATTPAGETK